VWPNHAYRDEQAAHNLRWWQQYTGDKVAYRAANAHTAVAPDVDFYVDGTLAASWASVGSYLERWYGAEYESVGVTFNAGSYYDRVVRDLPAAAPQWVRESPPRRALPSASSPLLKSA